MIDVDLQNINLCAQKEFNTAENSESNYRKTMSLVDELILHKSKDDKHESYDIRKA